MKIIKSIVLIIVLIVVLFGIISMIKPELRENFLEKELNELKSYIAYSDSLNTSVSKAPVSWHIDHTLLTINEIYKVMETSSVKNYKSRFNFGRAMMFTFNKIPRGRAKSPKQVNPIDYAIKDTIQTHLNLIEIKMSKFKFDVLPEKAHFKHPFIGVLKRKQAKRFLKIHTNHHLAIIRDILKKS